MINFNKIKETLERMKLFLNCREGICTDCSDGFLENLKELNKLCKDWKKV